MDDMARFVIAGCVGGLVPDLIRLIKGPVDGFYKTRTFWVQLIAQVALGGIAAYFLSPESIKEAFTYGFSAPEVMTRLAATGASAAPTQQTDTQPGGPPIGGGAPPANLRLWWAR